MATLNEELFDIMVSHQIGLQRLNTGVTEDLIGTLNSLEDKLQNELRTRLDNISARGIGASRAAKARLEDTIRAVQRIRQDALDVMAVKLAKEAKDLALYETEFIKSRLEAASPLVLNLSLPTTSQAIAAVTAVPFGGKVLKNWIKQFNDRDLERLATAVRTGFIEGESTDSIVRRVIGTRRLKFTDGILHISRRSATTLVRTSLNHTANIAREEMWKENANVIDKLRWTSILDGRTSPICQSRDGNLYDVNKGPRPPAHPNCRSVMTAVVNGIGVVGTRITIKDKRTRKQREIDFRKDAKAEVGSAKWKKLNSAQRSRRIKRLRRKWADENIGRVPAATTYEQWLRKQPAKFQDEVLGPTKGRLFRKGGVSLDKFVDRRGQALTLRQLQIKELEAFKKAGLLVAGGAPVATVPFTPLTAVDFTLSKDYAPFKKKMSINQIEAMQVYKTGDFELINGVARGNRTIEVLEETGFGNKNVLKDLDSIFDIPEATLKHDILVYRGFESISLRNKIKAGTAEGTVFQDKGFTSTTFSRGVVRNFLPDLDTTPLAPAIELEIRIPKALKQKAVPLDSLNLWDDIDDIVGNVGPDDDDIGSALDFFEAASSEGSEMELLLPRNTKFRILKATLGIFDKFNRMQPSRLIVEIIE